MSRARTSLFTTVDRLLRGDLVPIEDLRCGHVRVPASRMLVLVAALGGFYGLMMGLFAVTGGRGSDGWLQLFAASVKVPLLFVATLLVTFPSLFVFSALLRSRLGFHSTLRMILVGLGINLAVLASFGPVTAFFTLSTSSYPFILLLNVLLFGVAGLIGLGVLRRMLDVACAPAAAEARAPEPQPVVAVEAATDADGAPTPSQRPREPRPDPARRVFSVWLLIYGAVGAQMAWVLRPFVGTPNQPFEWFRARDSNFFLGVLEALGALFS